MDANLKKLIDLYAKHPFAKLDSPDSSALYEKAIGVKYSEIYTQKWFTDGQNLVREQKKFLETEADSMDTRAIIIECSKYAWNEIVMNNTAEMSPSLRLEMEIFRELVLKTYENRFTEPQKKFFTDTIDRLMTQNLYFISYTNRLAPIINNKYYDNICKLIPLKTPHTDKDKLNRNLLAQSIHSWLLFKNYKKGFFDIESIRQTENIPEKVKTNVANSFALIQLIDTAAFTNEEVNWPHKEFVDFPVQQNQQASNKFFYITESFALPVSEDRVFIDYRPWYNEIKQNKNNLEFYKDVNNLEDFKLSMEKLIDDLYYLSVKRFEEVPA
jgi:hypothetical protein